VLDRLSTANIDLDDVAEKLEREGLASFAASFDEVIAALVEKAN
jgi:transaldolase